MNITLSRQPLWRIDVEGHDTIETEELTPLALTMLGAVIANRVHNDGEENLEIAISIRGDVDQKAIAQVRDYISTVHEHAVRVKRMAGADDAFEGVPR